jgi:pyrroline-5-carboxylate reductase
MGVAILSGVLDSLDVHKRLMQPPSQKWESHTPGTRTPLADPDVTPDSSLPTRFIACVSREASAKKLKSIFGDLGPLGKTVETYAGKNVLAVQQSDVILLW